jgi:26S proteasome regulatory subunit N2
LEAEGKLPPGSKGIDPRLEGIVNRMFQRCLDDNQYRQALGLALETRRMDIFEAAIMQSVRIFLIVFYDIYVSFFNQSL